MGGTVAWLRDDPLPGTEEDGLAAAEAAWLLDPDFDAWSCDLRMALRLANETGVERGAVLLDGDEL